MCKPCRTRKRLEWANRMMLESYGKPYRPLFVTPTYKPEDLPNNYSECLSMVQKWIKRLRKQLPGKFRYFGVTERGSKKGRLHQHLLIWNQHLCTMPPYVSAKILHESWKHGILTSDPIRSPGGYYYVSKYITKNMFIKNETGEIDANAKWSRKEKNYRLPGRIYTWSNKPSLGHDGIERWKYLTRAWNGQYEGLPPNWFNMSLLGQMQKVYVPSDTYKIHMKELGIDLQKKYIEPEHDPINPVNRNKIWLDQKVLERIDIEDLIQLR